MKLEDELGNTDLLVFFQSRPIIGNTLGNRVQGKSSGVPQFRLVKYVGYGVPEGLDW